MSSRAVLKSGESRLAEILPYLGGTVASVHHPSRNRKLQATCVTWGPTIDPPSNGDGVLIPTMNLSPPLAGSISSASPPCVLAGRNGTGIVLWNKKENPKP